MNFILHEKKCCEMILMNFTCFDLCILGFLFGLLDLLCAAMLLGFLRCFELRASCFLCLDADRLIFDDFSMQE